MKKDLLAELLERPETVWSVGELAQIMPELEKEQLYNKLRYFVRVGKLQRINRGIYARRTYEPKELANKLYKPSYISLETVLAQEGVIFQYYETIYVVSYINRKIEVDGEQIQYRNVKKSVLLNNRGIIKKNGYFEATRERAWLDSVYLYQDYHFDHLDVLDWNIIWGVIPIYKNKSHEKRVKEYYKIYLEEK